MLAEAATVRVTDVWNAPPVAADDAYTVQQHRTLTVSAPGVLANDGEADDGRLTAALVTAPAHGGLALQGDGAFTYMPDHGFCGLDCFTYTAADGMSASAPATVTIAVLREP